MTTRVIFVLLATLGSAALLAGAYGFEHIGGLAPCKMCYWQRWPHFAAVAIGLLVLGGAPRAIIALGALAALTTSGVGFFHAGVEQGWWEGPSSCTGGGAGLTGLSGESLLATSEAATVVMCDQISWQMLGLSMPAWNGVISLALFALWLIAFFSRKA